MHGMLVVVLVHLQSTANADPTSHTSVHAQSQSDTNQI